jgi:uncharacterized protein
MSPQAVNNMKLASEFSVPATPDQVFPLFFDAVTMRSCIPGCEELERLDDTNYRGRLVNEVAHVRFAAGFSAVIESVTEPSEVTAVLKGEDRRLASSIKIVAKLTVRPGPGSSTVGYELDMALWGKLGRLGEPVIRRRSKEVEQQFAEAFAAACRQFSPEGAEAGPEAEKSEVDGKAVSAPTSGVVDRSARRPKLLHRLWRRLAAWFRRDARRAP